MNLKKLFDAQKVLRERIDYNESDRFEKLVLALLVEIGECANEWRGFKFWSQDQQQRTKKLLEEYVDGLHFVLELGIERGNDNYRYAVFFYDTTEKQFISIMKVATILPFTNHYDHEYRNLIQLYLGLGEMLGFTPEQIEDAYFSKNQINHQRQEEGY